MGTKQSWVIQLSKIMTTDIKNIFSHFATFIHEQHRTKTATTTLNANLPIAEDIFKLMYNHSQKLSSTLGARVYCINNYKLYKPQEENL